MVRPFRRLLLLVAALAVPAFLPAATENPPAGTVLSLAPSAYREGVVYAATETGVFRSVNGGETWEAGGQGLPAGRITSVAASPWNAETAYATTHRGLFQTTNGGATWSAIGLHIPLFEIALSPSSFEILYVSDGEIVYRSDEEGALWTPASGGLPEVLLVAGLTVHPTDPNTVYAATNLGLYKTTDGGGSWRPSGKDLGAVRAVAVDPKFPQTVYAATGFKGLFKSRDGGATWKRVRSTTALLRDVVADPRRSDRVYVGIERLGLLRSEDGGFTWSGRELPRRERETQ